MEPGTRGINPSCSMFHVPLFSVPYATLRSCWQLGLRLARRWQAANVAEVLVIQLFPTAVRHHLVDDVGDELGHVGLALLDADAVKLGRELAADQLQCVIRSAEAGKNDVVSRHGVHTAVLH